MTKFKRTFDVTVNFADGKYGPYCLTNVEAKDFDDVISKFLKNVEYSRTGHDPKCGDPSGIDADIVENIRSIADDTMVKAELDLNQDIYLHDLEMHGLAWFREKAVFSDDSAEFISTKNPDHSITNTWPKDCTEMYAVLGYDTDGLQRGDIVKLTIRSDKVDVEGVDTNGFNKYSTTLNNVQNSEKYLPFMTA